MEQRTGLTPKERLELKDLLERHFSMDELKDLAFALGISYEQVPHETLPQFAREFISYCARLSQLGCLLELVAAARPNMPIAGLLASVEPCDPRVKVQLILPVSQLQSHPDLHQAVAALLGIPAEQVQTIGALRGSARVLIGLPAADGDRLVAPETRPALRQAFALKSALLFDELSDDVREEWRVKALSGQADVKRFLSEYREETRPPDYLAQARSVVLSLTGKARASAQQAIVELTRHPQSAPAHRLLGQLLADAGRPDLAETAYRTAIQLDPTLGSAYTALGNLMARMNRAAEAEQAYRTAISLDPRSAWAHNNLAVLYAGLQRYAEAEQAYRGAIEIDGNFGQAYNNLGNILAQQGRDEEAEQAYRRAIEIMPRLAQAHANLGALLVKSQRYDEAAVLYRAAMELDPRYASAYDTVDLLLKQRRADQADNLLNNAFAE
ncbi:MAG: tetratricopeptide repeat protein [Chloroflexi bacterium]|nr:tetratricopeptide repeat protein [Chloroflexota bacterium]